MTPSPEHHEIARMAADAASRVATHVPYDRQQNALGSAMRIPTPEGAGAAVTAAYLAALKALSASGEKPLTPGS